MGAWGMGSGKLGEGGSSREGSKLAGGPRAARGFPELEPGMQGQQV